MQVVHDWWFLYFSSDVVCSKQKILCSHTIWDDVTPMSSLQILTWVHDHMPEGQKKQQLAQLLHQRGYQLKFQKYNWDLNTSWCPEEDRIIQSFSETLQLFNLPFVVYWSTISGTLEKVYSFQGSYDYASTWHHFSGMREMSCIQSLYCRQSHVHYYKIFMIVTLD